VGSDAGEIGQVIAEPVMRVKQHGEVIADSESGPDGRCASLRALGA
jgi:hypothetical protein